MKFGFVCENINYFFDIALPRLTRFLLYSSKPRSFVNINKILFRSNYTGLGYLFCEFYGFFRDDNGTQCTHFVDEG